MAQDKGHGGRFKIIDHIAPGSELDPDFVKMQRELEETQKQGYLFGRGAFDQQDIIYLKEHKESLRNTEQDLEEMAVSEFALLKSRSDAAMDASIPQPGVIHIATKQKKEIRPVSKLLPIKIAPVTAKQKLVSPTGVESNYKIISPTGVEGIKRGREELARMDGSAENKAPRQEIESKGSGGLLGLGYSDSDAEEEEDIETADLGAAPVQTSTKVVLPHPDDLLSANVVTSLSTS